MSDRKGSPLAQLLLSEGLVTEADSERLEELLQAARKIEELFGGYGERFLERECIGAREARQRLEESDRLLTEFMTEMKNSLDSADRLIQGFERDVGAALNRLAKGDVDLEARMGAFRDGAAGLGRLRASLPPASRRAEEMEFALEAEKLLGRLKSEVSELAQEARKRYQLK